MCAHGKCPAGLRHDAAQPEACFLPVLATRGRVQVGVVLGDVVCDEEPLGRVRTRAHCPGDLSSMPPSLKLAPCLSRKHAALRCGAGHRLPPSILTPRLPKRPINPLQALLPTSLPTSQPRAPKSTRPRARSLTKLRDWNTKAQCWQQSVSE